ncbi:Fatty acid hydroxylase superfamily protein [Planctomycetes bacterium MalM25]|nr:Fatty acid hydroxylase superfamily protein [Planctomycetes bacterium MalM25]
MSVNDKLAFAWRVGAGFSMNQAFWYALFAGVAWCLFYWLLRDRFRRRRIGREDPTRSQVRRELLCSLRSIAIFGLVTLGVVYAALGGWTRVYMRVNEYGWGWFALSLVVMVITHDAYFYWTHRLMHHRWFYRWFHRTHHLSTSPTPWAAYAFSPAEAFVQAGIGPLVVFTIPTHPAAFSLFMIWQIAFNVLGHCGYEIFPRWFLRSPLGVLLNSVTHHGQHHETFQANYSLYFNVWDRLMGTNHKSYEERFDAASRGESA